MTFPLKNAFKQKVSMLDLAQGKIRGTEMGESSLNRIPSVFKLCTHGQNRSYPTEILKTNKKIKTFLLFRKRLTMKNPAL